MLQYADDRPWPGSTGWSDAVSRNALDVIADAVEHLSGYEVSCINVVHRGELRAVAVCGTQEQRALLMDSRMPVAAMEEELTHGDVLGRFVFIPAGRWAGTRDWGVVFDDTDTLTGEDAYDIEDMLAAPVRDGLGQMIGMLSVDLPLDRRRPGAATVVRLERYAELVDTAVRMALEHDEQQERIAMARATRVVVAAATRDLSMAGMFAESAQALMTGFSARGVWLQTFDPLDSHAAVHADSGVVHTVPEELLVVAERMAHVAWRERTVGILGRGLLTPGMDGTEHARYRVDIVDYLDTIGVGSILFVPIGAFDECLGCLVLSRAATSPPWTSVESESARDIGMDLGRAILNARAFEREQRAVAELQALDSYKSQLVATLSHELKTPLTSILGNLELLEAGGPSSDDGQRSVSAIGRGANRLVRVVDDLMLLAKVGDPGNQLITRPVDLVEVVEDVVELTAATARQRRLTVSFATPVEPILAAGDADELDRVVTNLLSNALKYTAPGGRIRLALDREGDEVVFTCSDTGIGIAAVDRSRLFREFFRSADPTAQGQPGTGLGLAIVDRIVQRHRGRVAVTSEVGVGSVFTVRLPATAPPA